MRYILVLLALALVGIAGVVWASDKGGGGFNPGAYSAQGRGGPGRAGPGRAGPGGDAGPAGYVGLFPTGGGGFDRLAPSGGGGFDIQAAGGNADAVVAAPSAR